QGKTADRVLISADFTIGQESFYVAASRARHELKIYTEDPTRLLWLAQQSKAKDNALELLRKQIQKSTFKQQQAITINISAPFEKPLLKQETTVSTPNVEPIVKSVASSRTTSHDSSTFVPVVNKKQRGRGDGEQVRNPNSMGLYPNAGDKFNFSSAPLHPCT
ncbi:MAG: hypothetical protein ACYTX0_48675, partial [Nostoc sp.]